MRNSLFTLALLASAFTLPLIANADTLDATLIGDSHTFVFTLPSQFSFPNQIHLVTVSPGQTTGTADGVANQTFDLTFFTGISDPGDSLIFSDITNGLSFTFSGPILVSPGTDPNAPTSFLTADIGTGTFDLTEIGELSTTKILGLNSAVWIALAVTLVVYFLLAHTPFGRKMYAGGTSFMPLRVNYSGVMPIIFAQSILMFPRPLFSNLANWITAPSLKFLKDFCGWAAIQLDYGSLLYLTIYALMILFFLGSSNAHTLTHEWSLIKVLPFNKDILATMDSCHLWMNIIDIWRIIEHNFSYSLDCIIESVLAVIHLNSN